LVPAFIHSTAPAEARLWRLDAGPSNEVRTFAVPPCLQPRRYDLWKGLDWRETLLIDTRGLASGVYVLDIRQTQSPHASYRIPIVLKPEEPVEIAVISSTNTWQAYNPFGGLSNYGDAVLPFPLNLFTWCCKIVNFRFTLGDQRHLPCIPLPYRRPLDVVNDDLANWDQSAIETPSHLIRAERSLLQFMAQGDSSYGVYSDWDVAFDVHISRAKLWIFHAHSEYWSDEMLGRITAFLERGGKVMFLSGNNLYRKVQFIDHGLMVYDFKVSKSDMSRLSGAAYDARGYLTYAGYKVADAGHWVFERANVQDGDIFGAAINQAGAVIPGAGASGYETDKIMQDSGHVQLLAIGTNAAGPAYMVFKEFPRGGWVFNCGSVAFAPWIDRDSVIRRMLENLISEATGASAASGKPESSQRAA
jgi:hypothetical protein